MTKGIFSSEYKDIPYLLTNDGIVVETGYGFIELTGYLITEIFRKNISEVFKLLRINCTIPDLESKLGEKNLFLFTKSYEAIEVAISVNQFEDTNEILYFFEENSNSRLSKKVIFVEQLFKDNIVASAVYSVPDLILLKGNQKYLDFMDSPFNKMENSIGRPIREIIAGLEGTQTEINWNKVLESQKTSFVKENKFDKFARGTTYWDCTQTPVFEEGKMKYIFETASEVTERVLYKQQIVEQSEKINQQKEQLSNIIDNVNDAIFIMNKNGDYILVNNSAKKQFPKLHEINKLGDGLNAIRYLDLFENEIPLEKLPISRAIKGETVKNEKIILRHNDDNDVIIETNSTPVYDKNGDLNMAVMSFHDVTQLLHSQRELKQQKELLETIIENMSEAFAIYDKEGNLILKNAEARKLYSLPEILKSIENAHNVFEYFDLDGNRILSEDLPARRALRGEKVGDSIIVIKQPEKSQITQVSATPVFDKDNNLTFIASFHRDITELVNNQKLLKTQQEHILKTEQEKNEALIKAIEMKDEFLSLISHELRTPLSVIISAIQAIQVICKNELSDRLKGFISKIKQNSLRQLRLVNNLLDITRMNTGHVKINMQNHDIVFHTKMIVESIYLYSEQKGINLLFKTTKEKKIIGLDEEKYERILLNLLSNAIKFTTSGNRILVTISSLKGFVCIKVKDEGIGIPDDKVELIFERFGQVDSSLSRQAEGSGIGLSLVKMFVKALGGSISVKSKIGKGSVFTVLLPSRKVKGSTNKKVMQELSDNRLLQTIATEFSDIYLNNNSSTEGLYKYTVSDSIQSFLERDLIEKTISKELSNFIDLKSTLTSIMSTIKGFLNCEAIGLRLYEDGDYPYYVYKGFPECFIKMENSLCKKDEKGNRILNDKGECNILECVCGKVILGQYNPKFSFYTKRGSFWTNNSSALTTPTFETEQLGELRGNCIHGGYESIALVPIKSKGNIIGLIHLNDFRKNVFSEDLIEFIEILGESIGLALENSLLYSKHQNSKNT